MKNRRLFTQYGRFLLILFLIAAFLCGCGYSREEKQQMREISRIAQQNAVSYIKDKYGLDAEVTGADVCTKRFEVLAHPTILGCAVISMKYEGKKFKVHISGMTDTLQGSDDFQHDVISEDAKAYFSSLLGYEIQDFYMEYSTGQEKNLINELYQNGDIENFMQCHSANIRIDDCRNQDFTDFMDTNPIAASFLEQYAADYGMKVILISYRSEEDYRKGYEHTYGRGGVMDFEIDQDGLYICSYALFEKENTEYRRFELQEYDGIVISCIDKIEGSDLAVSGNQTEWKDLGETKKAPVSGVYSIGREGRGVITVYIPYDQLVRQHSIHFTQ